ncbi:MAG: STM4013/SEN3800 family hydrolase [Planctomycetes bacterium]|nr:STM4013/SEN3800 family hydrolase [Planctomycetota bacterium]
MNAVVGRRDLAFLVVDALRCDVAQAALAAGKTPTLARLLPSGWEARHSPGNFTFPAHQAFFAGFWPTPPGRGPHPRRLAVRFGGSESTVDTTCVVDAPTVVEGLAARGYRTICVGGVGFFNPASPLGRVLPAPFAEAHWAPELGVTHPDSPRRQVALACERLRAVPADQRAFLFVNFSAVHQPNRLFLAGAEEDSLASHEAALIALDAALPPLFEALAARGGAFCVVCSDHGTAYGEDGLWGHRHNHPVVTTVPYAEFLLEAEADPCPR